MKPSPDVSEKDWAIYRKKMPDWQNAYMDSLNKEYIKILNSDGSPSDKFWELERRIKKDKQHPGVVIDMRRSTMVMNLIRLIDDRVIGIDDIADFSDEVKEKVKFILKV